MSSCLRPYLYYIDCGFIFKLFYKNISIRVPKSSLRNDIYSELV